MTQGKKLVRSSSTPINTCGQYPTALVFPREPGRWTRSYALPTSARPQRIEPVNRAHCDETRSSKQPAHCAPTRRETGIVQCLSDWSTRCSQKLHYRDCTKCEYSTEYRLLHAIKRVHSRVSQRHIGPLHFRRLPAANYYIMPVPVLQATMMLSHLFPVKQFHDPLAIRQITIG